MAVTHYETLGVPQQATQSEIVAAYRSQLLRWHPDKNGGSAESAEMFKRVKEAYAVLRDPSTRADYDTSLAEGTERARLPQTSDPQMFQRQMVALAAQLALQHLTSSRISEALQGRGCPKDLADAISHAVVWTPVQRSHRAGPREWDLPLKPRKPKGRRR